MIRVAEGFREIEHTADWELEVWGSDLPALFRQAALGMYALLGVELADGPRERRDLELEASDPESLLVEFLGDLLFLVESEGLGFDHIELQIDGLRLQATLEFAAVAAQRKEIKAVTFHRLVVRETADGFSTRVVFDV